jgi:hypothetical protein
MVDLTLNLAEIRDWWMAKPNDVPRSHTDLHFFWSMIWGKVGISRLEEERLD